MADDLDTAVVLRGPTWIGPFFLAAGMMAACIAIGLVLAHLAIAGAVAGCVGLGAAGLGLRILRHPTTLILAPEGLDLINLGIRRRWAWRDVDSFRIEAMRSAQLILFEDYSRKPQGQVNALPTRWDRPPREVVMLLSKARDRWSG
jgi:hypothetical protein